MYKSFFSVMFASLLFVKSAYAGELVINGSTTVLPVTQKIAEAFIEKNPTINISISGGGSGNGIKALIDNLTEIAMSSRPIKESELKKAEAQGIKPKEYIVGLDALVPVVNLENPVKSLTLEQLKDIYTGKITNWEDVGGEDERIAIISRDTSSGTYESWSDFVLKGARVTPRALLQASNGAVAQTVAKNKYAIGYVGFGYLDPSLKALQVNGVTATPETALKNTWPIARELWYYVDEKTESEDAKKYLEFALSPEGQKLVKEVGFIPVK